MESFNKRVLFIDRSDPTIRSGGGLATRAYIMGLNKLFPGKVDLILADSLNDVTLLEHFNIYSVPPRSKISKLLSLISGSLHRYKKYVYNFLQTNSTEYSLCVLNNSILAGDMVDMINNFGIKTITIHHNYEKEYHIDNKSVECFKGLFPLYVIRNEKNAYIKSSLNLFLTQQDKEKLRNIYGNSHGKTEVISVFEHEEILLKNNKKTKNKNITFVISGTMSSYQTLKGINDFYYRYYQSLIELIPTCNIIITGRNPDKTIIDIADKEKNINIIANPIDISNVIQCGDIYICPTNIGGGLKLRVMDGLKAGLPVLVNSVSARGYDCFYDKPWFQIYSDKKSFMQGLELILDWINKNENSCEIIQTEYLNNFNFNTGVTKFKKYLNLL